MGNEYVENILSLPALGGGPVGLGGPRREGEGCLVGGVYGGEKGYPYEVDKVPIPGPHLKPGTLLATKLVRDSSIEIINQEAGPYDDVHPMEASCHKKN